MKSSWWYLWVAILATNVCLIMTIARVSELTVKVEVLERPTPSPSPVWTTCDFAEERGVPCARVPE